MADVTYDVDVDCGYIAVTDAAVSRTEPDGDSVIWDFDSDGEVVGVEILSVSRPRNWFDQVAKRIGPEQPRSLLHLAGPTMAPTNSSSGMSQQVELTPA